MWEFKKALGISSSQDGRVLGNIELKKLGPTKTPPSWPTVHSGPLRGLTGGFFLRGKKTDKSTYRWLWHLLYVVLNIQQQVIYSVAYILYALSMKKYPPPSKSYIKELFFFFKSSFKFKYIYKMFSTYFLAQYAVQWDADALLENRRNKVKTKKM